jgi:hypothetical protein
MRKAYQILDGKPERKHHLEDLGINGKILKWIKNMRIWTNFMTLWTRVTEKLIGSFHALCAMNH